MATDRTIAQLRTVVRSLRCDPRTFFAKGTLALAIALSVPAEFPWNSFRLRTHEKVAPQERQSLRPFLFFA
jgi:hypothetical protein